MGEGNFWFALIGWQYAEARISKLQDVKSLKFYWMYKSLNYS